MAGWLAIGPVAAQMAGNSPHAAAALADWKRAYPQHPAEASLVPVAQNPPAAVSILPGTGAYPDQIALVLPLSGRSESVGAAVRDGFIAAYLQQDSAVRPRLRIYDAAAESVAGAYRHAVDDGAAFVVGPLTKEDVAAVVPVRAPAPLSSRSTFLPTR